MNDATGSTFDRRRFLSASALGGATVVGATALGAVDPDAAFAAPTPPLDPAVAATSFAEGLITGIDGGTLLHVKGSYGEQHRIQLTNATSIWKLHPTTADDVETGDGLYARGLEMPDGTIAADAVWVNIVNLDVTVRGIGKDRLALGYHGGELIGRIVPGRSTASYAGAALTDDLSGVRMGQHALVLGAWRPRDGAVDIARITVGH
ncbi:cell wall protein [Streptomyces sp. B8F3]|uniref:cell wall protein n=1 Tax=unclassified Streptomyces TaxID=2593676 RepID=UPI00325EE939